MRDHTLEMLSQLDLKNRKKLGQYFTPDHIRKALLNLLPDGFVRIMEPSFGTGEFIADLMDRYTPSFIDGYEIDDILHESVRLDSGRLTCGDFLNNDISDEEYDLVVGNPPYFQTKPDQRFVQVTSGRPNIFAYFIQEATRILRPGGYLAFVLPASMCTGAYFAELRRFITKNYGIRAIRKFHEREFIDANQSVVIFVAEKGGEHAPGLVKPNGTFDMYNDGLTVKGQTLKELGFSVKTGNVVWNQHKDRLTDLQGKVLVWSYNINETGFVGQKKRPQFILPPDNIKPFQGPALIVRRTFGSVGKGQIQAGIWPMGEFYAENHVNVVFDTKWNSRERLEWLLEELNKPITNELARRITGNTQLSKNELQNLLLINVQEEK